jgi:uracil-DNA glycosylase family 4
LLIVGLAPGLKGANRTGRPFTGDYAGDLLYATMLEFGFARGVFAARPDDGLQLVDAMLANAVRCVPPQNKPTPAEIASCRPFLIAQMDAMPRLKAILALGRIAHESTARTLGVVPARLPFTHGGRHEIARPGKSSLRLFDSYHCSRYNTNTGVLTTDMFRSVFRDIRAFIDAAD